MYAIEVKEDIMPKNEHHVVPNKNGWGIKKNNSQKSIKNFDKKQNAVDYARKISRNQRSELVIHNKDGKIRQKDSHGNDTYPPKG